MDFSWVFLAAFLLWLFQLLGFGRRQEGPRPPARRPPGVRRAPHARRAPSSDAPARPRTAPRTLDPSQHEGIRLEQLLRELERTMGRRQADPLPRRVEVRLPERTWPNRPSTAASEEAIDLEDGAELIEQRRVEAALARNRALAAANHQDQKDFDRRTSEAPAPAPARHRGRNLLVGAGRLRDAMVLAEILGPPVALRRLGDPMDAGPPVAR